jgi:F-type H+-transporting ATPase subunit b
MLAPVLAFGAKGGEAAAEEGIPTALWFQVVNFCIYAGLLIYFLRQPIKNFFNGREERFRQAIVKAEAAKRQAEEQKRDIQERLTKLQASSQGSVEDARREAEALRARIVKEAEEMVRHMKTETQRTVDSEIHRAKDELRDELLNQAVALSTKILTEKIAEPDQKRLQTEFVDKIRVVNT